MNDLDPLDHLATEAFPGRVVKKEIVRQCKAGANVPVYVLEYLLGTYCATADPAAAEAGLAIVRATLADNFVRPDESNKVQSLIRERGRHRIIDKVKVRYVSEEDTYWAEIVNFGHRYVHIPEKFVKEYDRLLLGGVWAELQIRHSYDEEAKGKRSPFWIEELIPIQLARFDLDSYTTGRRQFTTEQWIDLLIRSIGLEPANFDRRTKLLYLVRLIPFCENNYNLVELGPRETGKSYAYQEISPYGILLTGPTTVANLFYNMSTGKMGLVGLWDVVAFDEVADLQKMPKEIVTMLKTYCESGTFARGREALSAYASIAFFGNINQPVEVLVRSSNLFAPMPDVIREDMAFLDRIHYYLPGWELEKMRRDYFTDHYGFVVDYMAEALRELRKQNHADAIYHHFSLGAQLKQRDVKAVQRTVSGLIKLVFPHNEFTKEELAELIDIAMEGRRRVKEQLKKLGSFEFHQTSFSYIDNDTREEFFVGVPEEGGRNLIATDPLPAGSVYTASVDSAGRVGLYRIEVSVSPGTGKLKLAGGVQGGMKESVNRAFGYLLAHKGEMAIASAFDTSDLHVEAVDLLSNRVPAEIGVAFVLAVTSALKKNQALPGLLVLGDLSVQGNLKPLPTLAEVLQVAMDNGARRALIPLENRRTFFDVPGDIMERVDPVFYGDVMTATLKGLGLT